MLFMLPLTYKIKNDFNPSILALGNRSQKKGSARIVEET